MLSNNSLTLSLNRTKHCMSTCLARMTTCWQWSGKLIRWSLPSNNQRLLVKLNRSHRPSYILLWIWGSRLNLYWKLWRKLKIIVKTFKSVSRSMRIRLCKSRRKLRKWSSLCQYRLSKNSSMILRLKIIPMLILKKNRRILSLLILNRVLPSLRVSNRYNNQLLSLSQQ